MNELYGLNRTCIVNIRLLAQRQLGLLNGIKGNGAGEGMMEYVFEIVYLVGSLSNGKGNNCCKLELLAIILTLQVSRFR